MNSDPNVALDEVRASLVGTAITFRRLAGNSLLLYVDHEPGDRKGHLVWLEPTWQLTGSSGVLAGSRQAQDCYERGPDTGQARASAALAALEGNRLTAIEVDPVTYELILRFERGQVLRTFVADPEDDETWYVRDVAGERMLRASPRGLAVVAQAERMRDE